MKTKKYKIPPDQYRKLLKELELIKIRMIKSNCTLNYKDGELQPVQISEKTQVNQIENGKVEIIQSYKLTAKFDKSEEIFINISASYQLQFLIKFEYNEDFFDIYKKISLPLTTFPFFREYIFNITSRMNIPPLTLPLVVR